MTRSVYAWGVLNPKAAAGLRWRIFRSRRSARDYRKANGGELFKIVRTR